MLNLRGEIGRHGTGQVRSIAAVVYGPNSAVADPHREETTPTGWWWYVNANDESLPDFLLDNEARLVDIETYQDDAFIETRRMALVK